MASVTNGFGRLALEFGGDRFPVTVLHSGGGYYLGTIDPESGPFTRESLEYFKTEEAASTALKTGEWTQRLES